MDYCPSCGASIGEEKYCPNCGKQVSGIVWAPKGETAVTTILFLLGLVSGVALGDAVLGLVYGSVLAVLGFLVLFIRANLGEKQYRDKPPEPMLDWETSTALTIYPVPIIASFAFLEKNPTITALLLLIPLPTYFYRRRNSLTSDREIFYLAGSYLIHVFALPFGILGLLDNLVKEKLLT